MPRHAELFIVPADPRSLTVQPGNAINSPSIQCTRTAATLAEIVDEKSDRSERGTAVHIYSPVWSSPMTSAKRVMHEITHAACSSVIDQEIGWEKSLRNELPCIVESPESGTRGNYMKLFVAHKPKMTGNNTLNKVHVAATELL